MKEDYTPIYILTWNPQKFIWNDFQVYISHINSFSCLETNWSIRSKKARPGDRFILLRQGSGEKNGIIGYGDIISEPYDHFEFGRFIDIRLSKLQKDTIISTAVLRDRFPDSAGHRSRAV